MLFQHLNWPEPTVETAIRQHHGQRCQVIRELGDSERDPEIGRMWHIQFEDGFETDAFEEELVHEAEDSEEGEEDWSYGSTTKPTHRLPFTE